MGKHGENIRKRKDGRWEARIIVEYDINGKAKYRSLYGKTYLEAKEKRMNFVRNIDTDTPDTRRSNNLKITVSQVMQEWMDFKRCELKESTYAHYTNLLNNHILPMLGEIYLSSLTTEMINDFLKKKLYEGRIDGKGGLSPKTVSDIRSLILLGLKYARQQQYPCSIRTDIFSPRVKRVEKKILSREEQAKLEKFLYQYPDSVTLGILITLYSGIRIGELCALQWGDIHYGNGTMEINKTIIRIQNIGHQNDSTPKKTRLVINSPKTEYSNRFIPLPAFILNFTREYQRAPEVFLTTGTRRHTEPRTYLGKYKKILKKVGIEPITFHALRHTFATRCVENGFDIKSLSEILGHASVSTTMKNYVHPSLELKKMQMDRLEQISIWGQTNGQLFSVH